MSEVLLGEMYSQSSTILKHIAQVFADCTVQHNSVVCFRIVFFGGVAQLGERLLCKQ